MVKRLSALGAHQLRSPKSRMSAGTRSARTNVASKRIAKETPNPKDLMEVTPLVRRVYPPKPSLWRFQRDPHQRPQLPFHSLVGFWPRFIQPQHHQSWMLASRRDPVNA